MSNGNNQETISRFELTKSHVDALVTVATAVLVLSITFINGVGVTPSSYKYLLKGSWILFTTSIASGISYGFVLLLLLNATNCLPEPDCGHRKILFILQLLLHISFFTAAALFLVFALITV
jgi:hypothetical protein